MALPSWKERTSDVSGPKPMNVYDYTDDVPLNNASPTEVWGMIENTPGNTPLYSPLGGLYEEQGKYQNNSWREVLFQNAR